MQNMHTQNDVHLLCQEQERKKNPKDIFTTKYVWNMNIHQIYKGNIDNYLYMQYKYSPH